MGKKPTRQKKKPKLEVVFDEKKRKEFLTGFRKRKNERKKKAKDELKVLIKEEKKRIRNEVKDGVKNLKKSFAPIPEIEEMLLKEDEEYEEEDEAVTVKVVQLTTSDFAAKKNFLGINKPADDSENDEKNINGNISDNDGEEDEIPGMGIYKKKKIISKPIENTKPTESKDFNIKSKKDLNRIVQSKTTRFIRNSKVFKMKQNLDRLKNRKKARQERTKQTKLNKKLTKRRTFNKQKSFKSRSK